jgi:hypothetical protein
MSDKRGGLKMPSKTKNKTIRLSASEASMLKKITEKLGTDESKAIRRLIRQEYERGK